MPKHPRDEDAEDELEALKAAAAAERAKSPASQISGLSFDQKVGCLHFSVPGQPAAQYSTPEGAPLVLTYFAIQGLGEVSRLLLAEAGASYEHVVAVDVIGDELKWRERWAASGLPLTGRGRSPNGLLPTVSGLGVPRAAPISQSATVVRFLAKRFGLVGSGELEALSADILYETARDLWAHKVRPAEPKTTSPVQEAIAAMGAEDQSSAKGPWALAKRIETMLLEAPSLADPAAAINFGQIQLGHHLMQLEARKSGCVVHLSEALDRFRQQFCGRPRIAEYLASKRRFPATFGELGQEGGYKYATGPLTRGELTC